MVIVIKNTGSGVVAESVIINSFHFSMKRNFYALAAAVLLGSAVSASAGLSYTVNPESGSTVASLSQIVINVPDAEMAASYSEMEPADEVTVTKDGATFTTVQFKDDYTVWNNIIIELNQSATESGTYQVYIPAGKLLCYVSGSDSEPTVVNDEAITLTYNIEGVQGAVYDVVPSSVIPIIGSTMNLKDGIYPLNLMFAGEYQMKPGAKAVFACAEVGYSQEVEIVDFSSNVQGMYLVKINDADPAPTKNGEYTVTIPKGSFGTESFFTSNGEQGFANDELVYHYTIEGEETGGGEVGEVTVNSVVYQPATGDAVTLTEGVQLPSWMSDSRIEFNTSNNSAVKYIRCEVVDKNPLNPDEAMRVFENRHRDQLPEDRPPFWTDDDVPYLTVGSEMVFQEGHTYEISAVLYDLENPPYARTEIATYTTTIQGTTPGYQYADAKLVSVTPDPETYMINNLNDAHFTMTFDGWVKVDVTRGGIPGVFGLTPISEDDITYSDDHKEITFTFPASEVNAATGSLSVSLYVVDQDGRAVFTGSDTKEDSYFSYTYACYLGSPDLTVEPGDGVVTEIKDILISCPVGPADGMINPSYATSEKIRLTDKSGDVVFAEFTADPVVTQWGEHPKDGEFPQQWKFSLDEAITEPGVYVLNIPAGYFALGSEYTGATSKAQFVTYTIEGEEKDNTVYDLIVYLNDVELVKNEDGAIVKAIAELECDEDIVADYGKQSDTQLKDFDNNVLDATFVLDPDNSNYKIFYLTITSQLEEGQVYSIVLPQGILGTDAWAEGNYLTGNANPLCALNFDTNPELPEVVYDMELTTSVEFKMTDDKITKAIVSFDNGEYTGTNEEVLEEAVLQDALGNDLDATIAVVWVMPTSVAHVGIDYAFEPDQKYYLVVAEGTFGDEEWEMEDFLTGHANAAMKVEIDTTGAGVENVLAGNDVKVDVYNLQGIMLVKDADAEAVKNLPAGLYIIGGQKVAVK